MPRVLRYLSLFAAGALIFQNAWADSEPVISPEALPLINGFCAFYQQLPAFKVNGRQMQHTDGQLKADCSLLLTERKPREAKIQVNSSDFVTTLVSDGKSLTLHRTPPNTWCRREVTTSFAELTKQFATGLDVLVADDVRKVMLDDVLAISKEQDEDVLGTPCHRLLFKQKTCDVTCWIAKGSAPLLERMLIHAEKSGHTVDLETQFSNWDTHPALSADEFAFQPPASAMEVQPPKE